MVVGRVSTLVVLMLNDLQCRHIFKESTVWFPPFCRAKKQISLYFVL